MTDPLQLPEIPALSWRTIWTWVAMLTLASWGGVVQFLQKRRQGVARPFNLTELIGEMCCSAFAGVLMFLLCAYAKVPITLTAAAVGIAGHFSARTMYGAEKWLERKFPFFGGDQGPKP
jgi:hypothetical protein